MNELKDWLMGQHYYDGVNLLRKWLPGHEALRLFSQGPNPTTRTRLAHEIRMLIAEARPQPVHEEVKQAIREEMEAEMITPESEGGEWLFPEAIAKAIRERAKKVNERDRLSNSLRKELIAEVRAGMVSEMKGLQEEIAALSEKIDLWKEKGLVKVEKAPVARSQRRKKNRWKSSLSEEEKTEMERKLKDLRSTHTKRKQYLEKWMSKTDDPTHPAMVQRYRIMVDEVGQEIEKLMKECYE